MTLQIEYFDAAGNATNAGVFIPIAALPGIISTELAPEVSPPIKQSKVIFSILNRIFDVVSPTSFAALGLTVTKNTPSGTGINRIGQTFSATWQKLVDLSSNSLKLIPVPSTGANLGLGEFSLLDIFPLAEKVAAAGAVSGAGIVIATAPLTEYDSDLVQDSITISNSSDNRNYLFAFLTYLSVAMDLRSATVASALSGLSASSIGATAIPAAFTQSNDPTSDIDPANLPKLGIITKTLTYTVELEMNTTSQTFDVRVATT
jgi:hypothetical protein